MANESQPWGENVLVDFDDGIAWVTLNRPAKRNAMNPALIAEMKLTVEALATDERCGVFVLTGAGESFTAGMGPGRVFSPDRWLTRYLAVESPQAERGVAVAPLAGIPEADHRHGQRVVFWGRVYAARGV